MDHDAGGAQRREVPPELVEPLPELEHQVELAAREIDHGREQQLLGAPPLALEPGARAFVEDALVGRVLVDDHQAAAHRGQDVGAVELPQLGLPGPRSSRLRLGAIAREDSGA